MVDAEFAVQYLVLSQSAQHPELIDNVGNIALLQRAEAAGLLPAGPGGRGAYRELRRVQHQSRLNEGSQVDPASVQVQADAIRQLWQTVFGDA
jgi:glutamate-ammonia-ligase adenylyltransferase